ncbi:hypothetical protein BGZ99_001314 [Dissophora globulifera]|uniref:Uncharacterized protein n=1 Tax=Dissophora globulifera TaxID=979702 RepID=A0A9P6UWZ0_9FUNG|nr:hypothetical protein BGZ99_001314 [Dissophora globulifera]
MDPPYQQFRSVLSTGISEIRTRFDDKTGCYVILWNEIQIVFKDAHYVTNDSRLVPFMLGDDWEELTPKRIEYCPGVVLQVIQQTHTQDSVHNVLPTEPENSFKYIEKVGSAPLTVKSPITRRHMAKTLDHVANIASGLQNLSDLTSSTVDAISTSSVSLSAPDTTLQHGLHLPLPIRIAPGNNLVLRPNLAKTPHHSFHPYSRRSVALDKGADVSGLALDEMKDQPAATQLVQLYGSYVDAEMSGQAIQTEQFKNIISQRFNLSPSGLQLTDVVLLQMLQTQNQILTRQAFLQNSVQALITQNYELLEYPIPRLFVVLPRPKRLRDKFKPTTSFKLYFLCECGEHTATPGTRIPHEIHLARHEGYNVDQPNRFFEKYGSYILTIMKALRFGVTVAGVAIPPLLHVSEGIKAIEKIIGVAAKEVGSLMDETIRYIKDYKRDSNGHVATTNAGIGLDMLEALEGADLRELQSYLSSKDESRVLGNLNRIVTLEGHVKWVCMDHYRENYRQISIQQFKDVVASNRGEFDQKRGSVRIHLKTSTLAKQFYDALVKVRGVSTLSITLEWDATMSDLRTLASAVNKTNITGMTLWGQDFNRPATDLVNYNRRYDPIVQLMCNGRIHSMELRSFKSFFQHVSSSSTPMTSQLKKLYLDVGPFRTDKSSKLLFTKLLRGCLSLSQVTLEGVDLGQCFQFFQRKCYAFQGVEVLDMRREDPNGGYIKFVVGLLHGAIQSAVMSVNDLAYLSVDEEALAFNGVLTKLSIESKAPSSGPELNNLLRNNQALTKLKLHYFGSQSAIIDRVVDARNECLSRNGTSSLHETEVLLHMGKPYYYFSGLKMTLTFHDDSNAAVISSVFYYSVSCSDSKFSLDLSEVLEEYSWTIHKAELSSETTDDVLLLLHKGMQKKGSRLTSMSLCPQSLTYIGVDCLDEIIKLSGDPELHLDFSEDFEINMKEDVLEHLRSDSLKILETYLPRFASTLRGLKIGGFNNHFPIEVMRDKYSTRLDLPKLEELALTCGITDDDIDTLLVVDWVTSMATVPPCQAGAISQSQKVPLTWTPLKSLTFDLGLCSYEWVILLEGLDYSTLKDINLSLSNFSVRQLQILLDSIPADTSSKIHLHDTLVEEERDAEVDALLSRIQMKAPNVTILIH